MIFRCCAKLILAIVAIVAIEICDAILPAYYRDFITIVFG